MLLLLLTLRLACASLRSRCAGEKREGRKAKIGSCACGAGAGLSAMGPIRTQKAKEWATSHSSPGPRSQKLSRS